MAIDYLYFSMKTFSLQNNVRAEAFKISLPDSKLRKLVVDELLSSFYDGKKDEVVAVLQELDGVPGFTVDIAMQLWQSLCIITDPSRPTAGLVSWQDTGVKDFFVSQAGEGSDRRPRVAFHKNTRE